MNNKKLSKLSELTLYFFMFSFVGWICEIIYAYIIEGRFVHRGFINGPLCPIYGFGAIILILIYDMISKHTKSNVIKFVLISAIFTVFEYLVSVIFELIFGIKWWDYSNEFLNFKGRICLMFSIIWGIFGLAFINYIYLPTKQKIEKIFNNRPTIVVNILLVIISIITLTDFILSSIKYLQ